LIILMPSLALCCPQERFFADFTDRAVALFGRQHTVAYDGAGRLRARLGEIPDPGEPYDVILIAGHGQMNEDTGAPMMLGRLTPEQWQDVVGDMVRGGHRARVVILDGCKSAAFLQVFLPLVSDRVPPARNFNAVLCNLGDSSTTVFGSLHLGGTVAAAAQQKMQLERAQGPRPGRTFTIPEQVPELGGQEGRWDGQRFVLAGYPNMTEQQIVAAFGDFGDWLAVPQNRQTLVQAAAQGGGPAWSQRLFVPSAVCEVRQAGSSLRMCGPFASYPDDMLAAYEHWQRYGPGGNALLVFREELWRVLERLETAGIDAFDNDGDLAGSMAALTEQVVPPAMPVLPRRPAGPAGRKPPSRRAFVVPHH
jgi:hypothetical protein